MARLFWLFSALMVFLAAGAVGIFLSRGSARQPNPDAGGRKSLEAARRALETGAFIEAVRIAGDVPEESGSAAQARLMEGVGFWKLNRWQAAEDAWNSALKIDPEVPEAGWHLLNFYFVEQRWREAEELALRLYSIEPDPRDRTLLLLELVRQDNERLGPDPTVLALERVLVVEPQNFHVQRVLGLCYVQLGRTREGAVLIERANALRPTDSEGWFTLVWYLYETGQTERLGKVWEQLPRAALEEARFHRYRGMWADAVGDSTHAERAFRTALEHDAADRKAQYQLAVLLRGRGAEQEAVEHESEARRLDEAREGLASCYTQAMQQEDNPSAELCRQFGRLCRELGRMRQADYWDQEATRRPRTVR